MQNKELKTKQLLNQTFSPDQSFSAVLFASWETWHITCFATLYTPYYVPKMYCGGIHNTIKSNELSSVMVVCRHGFHNGVGTHVTNWWMCNPHNFCDVAIFYEINIFMLKYQTWWWIFT